MNQLKNKHKGYVFYIIGEGPSHKYLDSSNFGEGVIIAMYRSLKVIEELSLTNKTYSLQKDKILYNPRNATLLVHKHESAKEEIEYKNKIVFDNDELGLHRGCHKHGNSLQTSIRLSEFMGAKQIILYGFDAHMNGDCTTYEGRQNKNYISQVQGMKEFKSNIDYRYEPAC
jgi:hypothetical protein